MQETKKLLSNSSIIFAGTITGSFFSYLFNMLVGRWLGPENYGEFSAIMSLLMILSVGSGAVLTVAMRYSGELYALKKYQSIKKLLKIFTKYALFAGVFLLLLGLVFIKPISNFLSIKDLLPIVIALTGFIFGFLMVVNKGVLQGTQRFIPLSILGILESLLKLTFGIILIKIGMEVSGAILAVVLSGAVAYFATFVPLTKLLKNKNDHSGSFSFDKREMLNYSWPTLITTILLVVSLNADVVLVKHYFSAEDAGTYAAISTIAKIITFLTAPVISVMFPMISEKKVIGDKHYRIFLLSIFLTLVGGLVVLGFYYVIPGTIIKILYGPQFVSFYYLLPQIGFAILLFTLINILVNYFLAIKNFVFVPIFAVILLAQYILISLNHSTIEMFIKIMILGFALIFGLLMGYYLFTKKEQLSAYFRGEYGQES